MADKDNGGSKTEKPTPKRLKDAQKKGDIPKSKDLTSTTVLFLWLGLFSFSMSYITERMYYFTDTIFAIPKGDLSYAILSIGQEAIDLLLLISAIFLVPVVFFALFIEFLQAGPIMTLEKVKPKMEYLNPAEGLKRMFSMDNLIEVIKSIIKTALLFLIAWVVFKHFLADILLIPYSSTDNIPQGMWQTSSKLLTWCASIFSFLAIFDAFYQRHSFMKKMRMSVRDIKQEVKDIEGNPQIKQERRQLQQEWSEQPSMQAAANANVLVVNPTHIAIAINYDKEKTPVPIIAAMGEDEIAAKMRQTASEAEVPIIRNIALARALLNNGSEGKIVPGNLFDIIAEVILWAQAVREEIEKQRYGRNDTEDKAQENTSTPPGEDLTHYPNSTPFSPTPNHEQPFI